MTLLDDLNVFIVLVANFMAIGYVFRAIALRRKVKLNERYGKFGRREWRVHSPSGSVPLGLCTYQEALALAMKMGKVSFVDEPNGLIFYDTHLGGPPPEGQDSGR
jgi:hypothetical protein